MATTLQHKRSNIAGSTPSTSSLALGEIAVNTAEGCLYLKVDDGTNPEKIIRIRGEDIVETAITVDNFVGDGTTTQFTLSRTPEEEQFVFVTVDGVAQQVDAYSLNNAILILSEAPALGVDIEARVINVRQNAVTVRDQYSFIFSITSDTTVITGQDDYGVTLEYDNQKVDVYYNGIRLVKTSDYTANDGINITLNDTVTAGDTIEVVSYSKASLVDYQALKPFNQVVSTTAEQLFDKFEAEDYRSMKYLIQMTNGTDYHVTEVLLLHDGTDVYLTEYGTLYTNNSLGTISADILSGYVRLLVTPANTSNTTVKGQRIMVTV
jgi:hypothetical protein